MKTMCDNMKCQYETDTEAELCAASCKNSDVVRRNKSLQTLCSNPDSQECKLYQKVFESASKMCKDMKCHIITRRPSGLVPNQILPQLFSPSPSPPEKGLQSIKPDFNLRITEEQDSKTINKKSELCEASCKTEDFTRRNLNLVWLCKKDQDSNACKNYLDLCYNMTKMCTGLSCK